MNSDWIVPNWPAPPHVNAVFTSRAGGVSLPPFDRLNLGDHVGDEPAHVAANRHILQAALRATKPTRASEASQTVQPVFLKQVHGTDVVTLTPETQHGTAADACITTQKNLACTIMVADCLPVLFTDTEGRFVAAAHAGWRGLADGVLGHLLRHSFESISEEALTNNAYSATKIIAWLGPCIGSSAFEVGDEVKAEFAEKLVDSAPFFKAIAHADGANSGKWLADLAGLARLQLKQLGLRDDQIFGNDSTAGWCTVTNPLRFFSHRRDAVRLGSSGRMAGCIWLV